MPNASEALQLLHDATPPLLAAPFQTADPPRVALPVQVIDLSRDLPRVVPLLIGVKGGRGLGTLLKADSACR